MRSRQVILCGCLLLVACQQQPAQQGAQSTSPVIKPTDVAFGYTNATNSRLLMLTDDNKVMETAKAQAMETAVCSEGRQFPLRYLKFQKSAPASNGRQSTGNFNNDEGHLFEIVRGEPAPEESGGETCLLVPPNYLMHFPIARNDFTKAEREARVHEFYRKSSEADSQKKPMDLTPFGPTDQFGKEGVARIEKEKGRSVMLYWLLYRAGTSQQVAAVEFNPVGDSLLGSVALVEGNRLSFLDLPASLKEGRERGGCWRVDDDCRFFSSEAMDVHAVFGAPGEQLIFFTSWGAEGQLIKFLQAKDGKLTEIAGAYRYHSPI